MCCTTSDARTRWLGSGDSIFERRSVRNESAEEGIEGTFPTLVKSDTRDFPFSGKRQSKKRRPREKISPFDECCLCASLPKNSGAMYAMVPIAAVWVAARVAEYLSVPDLEMSKSRRRGETGDEEVSMTTLSGLMSQWMIPRE